MVSSLDGLIVVFKCLNKISDHSIYLRMCFKKLDDFACPRLYTRFPLTLVVNHTHPTDLFPLYSSSSRVWAIMLLTSGKRGVITQSTGKGCLDQREDALIG